MAWPLSDCPLIFQHVNMTHAYVLESDDQTWWRRLFSQRFGCGRKQTSPVRAACLIAFAADLRDEDASVLQDGIYGNCQVVGVQIFSGLLHQNHLLTTHTPHYHHTQTPTPIHSTSFWNINLEHVFNQSFGLFVPFYIRSTRVHWRWQLQPGLH